MGSAVLWTQSCPLQAAATGAASPPPAAVQEAKGLSHAFRYATEQVLPAVVMIRTEAEVVQTGGGGDQQLPPALRRFFQDPESAPSPGRRSPRSQGTGSGVIIDPSGVVLTNNHVVAGGGRVTVRLHDGREFVATEVKTDPRSDVAVVKIDAGGPLPAARMGDSDKVQVGDWAIAVGAPFGLRETVTAGIISAKSRGIGITEREDFLQTDAAINPGNSGGPLVNLDGEVVGINTAISSASGGYDGIGFAVPINMARWVSEQLASNGTVQRAMLGVGIQPVTMDLATQFDMDRPHGALVTLVQPGSAAAEAGLRTGDVITQFNGQPVATPGTLQNLVEQSDVSKTHQVTVLRDGEHVVIEAELQLAEQPRRTAASPAPIDDHSAPLGLKIDDLTPEVAQQLGIADARGVVVTGVAPGSAAASVGLAAGMVISRVGQSEVQSAEAFIAAMEQQDPDEGILLLVHTSEGSRFVVLKSN